MLLEDFAISNNVFERALRMLIADQRMNHGDTESFAQFELDIHPDDFASTGKREFNRRFRSWAEDRIWSAKSKMERLARDGTIPVWRMITAPADWTPEGRHPGIYWAWDEAAADAHWGNYDDGNVKWLMHARVRVRDVDWATTLAMNANPSYEDEKEIRLRGNAPVNLIWWKQVR